MINPKEFFDAITSRGVNFFTGVPDSLLANFCSYVDDQCSNDRHLIAANEGNAIAIAMGYHMATKRVPLVYMQNSGLGNAVNPLTSLTDREVYKVPMLLVIGWRGEPGIKDEPQHIKQGYITLSQLDVLGIPYLILDANSDLSSILDSAFISLHQNNTPVALVVRKDTFSKYNTSFNRKDISDFSREDALSEILNLSSDDDAIISTTGKTSREVYELRVSQNKSQRDFLTVGGMGHTSSLALGVAIGQPERRVICLDGDGSLLMHMGSMPVISNVKPKKYIHVLLNNEAHESVGGQATSASVVNFERLADAVGYAAYASANDLKSLRLAWADLLNIDGPVLLEVKIKNASRADLGRPTSSAEQNKIAFMEAIAV